MSNETLKLVQSKRNSDVTVAIYIINIPMDSSIYIINIINIISIILHNISFVKIIIIGPKFG